MGMGMGTSSINRVCMCIVSMRVVPDQHNDRVVRQFSRHVENAFSRLNSCNCLSVKCVHSGKWWIGDTDNLFFTTAAETIEVCCGMGMGRGMGMGMVRSCCVSLFKCFLGGLEAETDFYKRRWYHDFGIVGPYRYLHRHRRCHSYPYSHPILPCHHHHCHVHYHPHPHHPNRRCHHHYHHYQPSPSPSLSTITIIFTINHHHHHHHSSSTLPSPSPSLLIHRFLEEYLGSPAIHIPFGQSTDQAHLGNERIRMSNLIKGKDVFKRFVLSVSAKLGVKAQPLSPAKRWTVLRRTKSHSR